MIEKTPKCRTLTLSLAGNETRTRPRTLEGLCATTTPYPRVEQSGWRDSNPRPLPPKDSALPTVPHPELFLV
jgi:hypothetical protein